MRLTFVTRLYGGLLAALFAQSIAATLTERANSGRLVFAHFMVGIVSDRTSPADYDADIIRAKAMGIDAFALNIGTDPFTDQQLGYAYQSAANNGFKMFISFDFNWWRAPSNSTDMGRKVAQYANESAQLIYDDAVFVSTFIGDALDVEAMRSAAGVPVFFVPNFHPGQANFTQLDGAFNWIGWPNNGRNKAPNGDGNVTVEQGDQAYLAALNGKPYMAPASPWFFTHYGPEVPYSKNWIFPGDLLWYNRWVELLALQSQFIEIVTWNDYGESHYVAPLSSKHYDDGASKWANDMPHDGWLDMARPFIAAYHDGASSPNAYITTDQLVYWYRPQPSWVNCDATDTTMQPANNDSGNYFQGRPNGWEDAADAVFVVALLTAPGVVHVNSGNNSQTFNAPAGASLYQVPMGIGQQSFALERNGAIVIGSTSLRDIIDGCVCGLYNYNAYVGTVPQGEPFPDRMHPDGLGLLTNGLRVKTCAATPSLGTSTRPYPTTSVSASTTRGSTASQPTSATGGSSSSTPPSNTGGSASSQPTSTSSRSTSSASVPNTSGSGSSSATTRSGPPYSWQTTLQPRPTGGYYGYPELQPWRSRSTSTCRVVTICD